jgi:hypothetical protein
MINVKQCYRQGWVIYYLNKQERCLKLIQDYLDNTISLYELAWDLKSESRDDFYDTVIDLNDPLLTQKLLKKGRKFDFEILEAIFETIITNLFDDARSFLEKADKETVCAIAQAEFEEAVGKAYQELKNA